MTLTTDQMEDDQWIDTSSTQSEADEFDEFTNHEVLHLIHQKDKQIAKLEDKVNSLESEAESKLQAEHERVKRMLDGIQNVRDQVEQKSNHIVELKEFVQKLEKQIEDLEEQQKDSEFKIVLADQCKEKQMTMIKERDRKLKVMEKKLREKDAVIVTFRKGELRARIIGNELRDAIKEMEREIVRLKQQMKNTRGNTVTYTRDGERNDEDFTQTIVTETVMEELDDRSQRPTKSRGTSPVPSLEINHYEEDEDARVESAISHRNADSRPMKIITDDSLDFRKDTTPSIRPDGQINDFDSFYERTVKELQAMRTRASASATPSATPSIDLSSRRSSGTPFRTQSHGLMPRKMQSHIVSRQVRS